MASTAKAIYVAIMTAVAFRFAGLPSRTLALSRASALTWLGIILLAKMPLRGIKMRSAEAQLGFFSLPDEELEGYHRCDGERGYDGNEVGRSLLQSVRHEFGEYHPDHSPSRKPKANR